MSPRVLIACLIAIASAEPVRAQSLNGFWRCELKARQPYTLFLHIANDVARFRDRVPLPITKVGEELRFERKTQDGRPFAYTLAPAGTGVFIRVTGRLKEEVVNQLPKGRPRPIQKEEFVNIGTCTRFRPSS